MKNRKHKLLLLLALSISTLAVAKVSSLRSLRDVDNFASMKHPLSVLMTYSTLKKPTKEERRAFKDAEKGFQSCSTLDSYKYARIHFGKSDLERLPELLQRYGINHNPHLITVLLFKKGKLVATEKVDLHVSDDATDTKETNNKTHTAQDEVYSTTRALIDNNAKLEIKRLIEERQEQEQEMERLQTQLMYQNWNNGFFYNGYYGYNNYYGYGYPYGYGFGFGCRRGW